MKPAVLWKFVGLWVVLASLSCGDDVQHTVDMHVDPPTAALAIDRTTASFGSIVTGQISPSTTLTVSNTGTSASGILTATIGGANSGEFQIGATTCASTLASAATCTVTVTFSPTSPGAKIATLTIAGNPGGSVTAMLDGMGLAPGALAIAVTPSSLGGVIVGATGPTLAQVTVTNTGGGATGALSLQAAGTHPIDFETSADTCTGMILAPSATCTFSVAFAPTSAGMKSALFQAIANPGGTVSGEVTGTGLAPSHLDVTPLSRQFGSVVTNQPSATLSITVANAGDVAAQPITHALSGADAAMFAVAASSTCAGHALAAGTSCTYDVVFTPSSLGGKTAQLTIDGGANGAIGVSLSGTGISPDQLAIAPSGHTFANTNVGASATAQVFTISNNAPITSGVLATSLGGTAAAQFQIVPGTDLCDGTTLAPAAECTISITFAPTTAGNASAELSVVGVPGGALTAGLAGQGIGPAELALAPSSRAFGSVATDSMSSPLDFVVTNTGGQASGVPTVSLSGTDASAFAIAGNTCTAALAPAQSCTVHVRFAPPTTGTKTAVVEITATPGGTVTGALSGDGLTPGELAITPSSLAFAPTSLGDTTGPETITLTNTGATPTGTITIATSGDFAATHACTSLAPGASCTVSATFTPTATGDRTGSLTASASPGGSVTTALSGIARPRIEIISLDSGPVVTPYDLGNAIINSSILHDVHVTVRNNTSGTKPLSVTTTGSNAFVVVGNTCIGSGTIAAPSGTCTITVRFAPMVTGAHTGAVTFAIGNGAANEVTQNLTGTGIDSLVISAITTSDFGAVPINTTSSPLQFRVFNPAGSALTGALATSLTGTGLAILDDECAGLTLMAGASCVVTVTFTPAGVGPISGLLAASASPGGAPSIAVTAAGVDPTGAQPTDITLTPGTIAENTPAHTSVGTLATLDADVGQTYLYALVGGVGATDNAAFVIAGAQLRTVGVFDYETKSSYAVRVRTTDSGGHTLEKALTVEVTNVDEPPTAVADSATVSEDTADTQIDVLANDTDVDGGPKGVESISQPAHGTAAIVAGNGAVTYRPATNYAGSDSFTYTLNGGSLATVTITVTAVDDLPVAFADAITIAEDSATTPIDVRANDTDVDGGPITIASVTQPASGGTVTITGGGTGLAFTPAANFASTATFSYTLNGGSSATVTVTVTPVDDAPLAIDDFATVDAGTATTTLNVLANDTDIDAGAKAIGNVVQPAHGTVVVAGDSLSLSYQPAVGYCSPPGTPDTFTYALAPGGDTATVTITVRCVSDVAVTLTDGATSQVAGGQVIYTLVASNAGPIATMARVTTALLPELSGSIWTCTATAGSTCPASGSGSIDTSVSLAVGGSATFTLTATIVPSATGTLVNTASITAEGTSDLMPFNNTASDSSALMRRSDVSITKTNGSTSVVPGAPVTYTIVVSNAGPSSSTGVMVIDVLPSTLTGATWTCTGIGGATCPASGTNGINTTVDLPAMSSATFTLTSNLAASATGTLVNTVNAFVPGGTTDPTPANNSATDTDTVTPRADLQITKTDGASTAIPGSALEYTIVVTNAGPSNAPGSLVIDNVPAALTSPTWTCTTTGGATCPASGTGSINTMLDLPTGSTATFSLKGTVAASATGTLANTASVASASEITDPLPGNNTATDTDTLTPRADLSITKTDDRTQITPGAQNVYTIVVANAGPSAASGITVVDTLPSSLTNAYWTCVASTGGTCGGSGTRYGNINVTINLQPGATATYTLRATVDPEAIGTVTNTASLSVPAGVTDPVTANNSATDSSTVIPTADFSVTVTDGYGTTIPGAGRTYTIVVTNNGPSRASATITSNSTVALTGVSWTCTSNFGGGCAASSGVGHLNTDVILSAAGTSTFRLTGTVAPTMTGTIRVSASVTAGPGVTDPASSNNSYWDQNTLVPTADVDVAINTSGSVVAGTNLTYTITARNVSGTSYIAGAQLTAMFPMPVTAVSWTCTTTGLSTCPAASGTGSLNALGMGLAPGGVVTFTVIATFAPATPPPNYVTTASVAMPAGASDPVPGNNTDNETVTITQVGDVSVTNTLTTPMIAGTTASYTIVVSNTGPSTATASVVDNLQSPLINGAWTCGSATGGGTCGAASGTGNLSATVTLPPSSSVTFTLTGFIPANAVAYIGSSTNWVTVSSNTTDAVTANNTASASATITRQVSLAMSLTSTTALSGAAMTYTATITNNGPSALPAASTVVERDFPILAGGWNWSCTPSAGAQCSTSGGSGNGFYDEFGIPVGGSIVYTFTGVLPVMTGTLNASIVAYTNSGDFYGTDSDQVVPQADLSVVLTHAPAVGYPNSSLAMKFNVVNNGPQPAAAPITVTFNNTYGGRRLAGIRGPSHWTCSIADFPVTCTSTSSLPSGSSTQFEFDVETGSAGNGKFATSTVSASGSWDPNTANNTETETFNVSF